MHGQRAIKVIGFGSLPVTPPTQELLTASVSVFIAPPNALTTIGSGPRIANLHAFA